MVCEEDAGFFSENDNFIVKTLGTESDDAAVAHYLFAVLREFDEAKAEYIFSESFDGGKLSDAITNRLLKAAGHDVIEA
jgi:L-threonylcarbamoyladenylate synthase